MRKADIATRIHQEAEIPEEVAVTLLEGILDLFKATLQQGEPISIQNFGVFTVRSKASRTGRNPRTGEEIIIAPRRVMTFRASPQFRTEVNAVASGEETVVPAD